jgi:hypothetical protein
MRRLSDWPAATTRRGRRPDIIHYNPAKHEQLAIFISGEEASRLVETQIMFRLTMAVASLALLSPVAVNAAVSDTHVRAESGAIAGRSPHQAYRPVSAAPSACGTMMHTIPAGKLPVYGTHALPKTGCADAPELASNGAASNRASR